MIHFVGAGSGAPDLITVRGKKYLEEADVVIYAGSLVNPKLLEYTKDICTIYNSAKMTLEEVLSVMEKAEVIQTYVYNQTFNSGGIPNYGYTTAVGLFKSLVGCVLVLICNYISKKVRNGRGIV